MIGQITALLYFIRLSNRGLAMAFESDEIGAVTAGLSGGVVHWLRTKDNWWMLLAGLLSAFWISLAVNGTVKKRWPDEFSDMERWGLSFLAGVVSSVVVTFAINTVEWGRHRLSTWLRRVADARLGADQPGVVQYGPIQPGATDFPPPRLPAPGPTSGPTSGPGYGPLAPGHQDGSV